MEMPAALLQQEIDRFMNIGSLYGFTTRKPGEPGYRQQTISAAEEQIRQASLW